MTGLVKFPGKKAFTGSKNFALIYGNTFLCVQELERENSSYSGGLMNQYLLLLGPALGFALGVFFTWFLTYARMRQVEKSADAEKLLLEDKLKEGETAEKNLATAKGKLEADQATITGLKRQLEERTERFSEETKKCMTLEEKVKKIGLLEKVISDLKVFEHEVSSLRDKVQSQEIALAEKKDFNQRLQLDLDAAKTELKASLEKIESTHEQIKEIAIIRERAKNLEQENEQLRNIEAQLRQINEIKEMYSRTVEENQTFKNQDMVRHFMEIKSGLQQSIKAYNHMLEMVNNPMLDDNRIIEIGRENDTVSGDFQKPDKMSGTTNEIMTEEESLDQIETETEELEKVDGVNV